MGFSKDISATEATDHRAAPGAYWVPVQDNRGLADKEHLLVFYGYASKAARDAGAEPIGGAVKQYTFNAEQMAQNEKLTLDQLFPEGVKGTLIYKDISRRRLYAIARLQKDTPVLDAEGKPVLDSDGTPQMRSFFEDAQNV